MFLVARVVLTMALTIVLGVAPSCSKSAHEKRRDEERAMRRARLERARSQERAMRGAHLERVRSQARAQRAGAKRSQPPAPPPVSPRRAGADAGALLPASGGGGPDASVALPVSPAPREKPKALPLLREPFSGRPDRRQPATAASKAWGGLRQAGRDDLAALLNGNLSFALDLYSRIRLEPRLRKANLFFSPWSISTALAMTTAGARGQTEKELRRVLHLTARRERVSRANARLMKELRAAEKRPQVRVRAANRLWVQKGMRLVPAFTRLTRRHYGAKAMAVDFMGASEKTRKKINRWVSQQTEKKIKELFKPGVINAQTRLVLANAVYFRGDWDKPFDKTRTHDAHFLLPGCRKIAVPTMRHGRSLYLPYARVQGLELLDLPYKGKKLVMTILLPQTADGLASVEGRLTSANLRDWFSKLRIQKVLVQLPRFRLESSFSLKDTLVRMGAPSAFGKADFTGITSRGGLSLAAVVHKAFVDVNEKGTEAAAATGGATFLSGPRRFFVNRSFLFLIRHRATGAVLFLGRIMSPKPGAKSTAVADCVPGAGGAGSVSSGRPGFGRRRRRLRHRRVHSVRVVGGLDREQVNVVIQRSSQALRQCRATTGGGSSSKRAGAIQLSLHVGTDGRVKRADILRSRRWHRANAKAQQCIRKLALSWRFPAIPTEPTVISLYVRR